LNLTVEAINAAAMGSPALQARAIDSP